VRQLSSSSAAFACQRRITQPPRRPKLGYDPDKKCNLAVKLLRYIFIKVGPHFCHSPCANPLLTPFEAEHFKLSSPQANREGAQWAKRGWGFVSGCFRPQ
jgi:hypothetical protein